MDMTTLDHGLLAGVFPAPPRTPAKKKAPKTRYQIGDRVAHVNRDGSEWTGYFEGDHSTEFIAETKREVLADLEAHAEVPK